ncbi:acyltransferase [Modestobacter sp. VKM Ac-2979]|uniref:acyltransferase n=1 Tax=unclassified Modestobacter TaxID=2643866 RepID=UPI0022AB698B|nr:MULTISPECIES: acyltransferase [unclassified Modestobacter]MCZ2813425.1 acyltransferase [Modestobacter sp. VKM Ac-2979]MCZ2842383.1 acyltransferase [Modestobacter sp. VKM Ac-2980]
MQRFIKSLADPRTWLKILRVLHFYYYSNVSQVPKMDLGRRVSMAPNVSIRNGERISIGEGSHIGERSLLWAGDYRGQITIGAKALFGPGVMVTASNYEIPAGQPVMNQPKVEGSITIGANVWLGAYVVVTAGVTIGDGAVVAAGAVVTKDLPVDCIAAGVPAKVIGWREKAAG